MSEEWRTVPGYPTYAVSNHGRICRVGATTRYRASRKMLGVKPGRNGYRAVALHADGKQRSTSVHVVVCETFHGPRPSEDHEVAHFDGDRLNNRADNLRWATRVENMADQARHGTRPRGDTHHSKLKPECLARGERNGGGGKLTEKDVRAIRADTRIHREIAADYGVVKSMVAMIKRKEAWKHVTEEVAA